MNKPSLPMKKAAIVGFTPNDARVAPGVNKSDYVMRPAKPSDASKSTYPQRSTNLNPGNIPITQVSDGQPKN
jgi:hypothetical protein